MLGTNALSPRTERSLRNGISILAKEKRTPNVKAEHNAYDSFCDSTIPLFVFEGKNDK